MSDSRDPPPKRPGTNPGVFRDDDERAAIGREHRTRNPRGVPIVSDGAVITPQDEASSFTPIPPELLAMFDDPRWPEALQAIWEHTANMEMRALQRVGDHADVRRLAETLLEIAGRDGKNGRIGQLRKDVDSVLSRAWWFLTVLVGSAGAAIVKLVIVGQAYGELKTQVRTNREHIQLVESVLFHIPLPAAPAKADP